MYRENSYENIMTEEEKYGKESYRDDKMNDGKMKVKKKIGKNKNKKIKKLKKSKKIKKKKKKKN